MSVLINPYVHAPVAAAATREYRAFMNAGSQATHVFPVPGVDIGSPEVGRRAFLIVHFFVSATATLQSATIGGVVANIHAQAAGPSGNIYSTALISAPLDAGATADVELTFQSGAGGYAVRIASYKVMGLISDTATDTATAQANGDYVKSVTIDVLEDGLLFAGCYSTNGAAFDLVGVTEDYDTATSASTRAAGGSLEVAADETNRTVTFDKDGTTNTFRGGVVAAAFR